MNRAERVLETFCQTFSKFLTETPLYPEKRLHIDLVVNPKAGAFRRVRFIKRLVKALDESPIENPRNPERPALVKVFMTSERDSETRILAHLSQSDPADYKTDLRLIVIAGGDGTSRGALISFLGLKGPVREGTIFFRLPLGTGNDAADAPDWPSALELLSGKRGQAREETLPVLKIAAQGLPAQFSFNIASVGLDAYVVLLTNALKNLFPGNSYALMVDVATLFYKAVVKMRPMEFRLKNRGAMVNQRQGKFLMAVLGISGHRTYGAGKRILPTEDNFCLVDELPLSTMLAYRRPFYEGGHVGLPGVEFSRGDALEITSEVLLPLQMDGEGLWLEPSRFPLRMTMTDEGLRVMK